MDFSSSEDELALPPGKPRKSTSNSATASPSAEKKRKITLTHLAGGGVPRKSYDWLAPSEAGASHHGPPSREAREEGKASPLLGWSPEDPDGLLGGDGVDGKGRKSHKRRKADNPGPGKAWRKGLKKCVHLALDICCTDPDCLRGMPIPWRGGEVFLDETQGGPGSVGSDDHRRSSLAGSPEAPSETAATAAPVVVAAPRAPSPTFVLADAATLGFPVFPKPIVPPKISLSAFPRVTQTFAPNNGGDAVFPRKERVRTWKETDRVLVGIGGGQLTFKSWAKGESVCKLVCHKKLIAQDLRPSSVDSSKQTKRPKTFIGPNSRLKRRLKQLKQPSNRKRTQHLFSVRLRARIWGTAGRDRPSPKRHLSIPRWIP